MVLRKITIVLFAILFIPVSAFCLDYGIGVKGGVGFSFFRGDDYQALLDFGTTAVEPYGTYFRTRFMLSYSAGVFAELGLLDFFSIQPEAIFTFGGGAYGYPENYSLYDYKEYLKMTYVELPALVKIRYARRIKPRYARKRGSFEWIRCSIYAGPGIAFLLGDGKAMSKVDGEEYMSAELPSNYFKDSYYFLIFGAGVDIGRGNSRTYTTVDLRYHMGWSSIMHPDMDAEDFQANNIQLLIGFAIGSGPGK